MSSAGRSNCRRSPAPIINLVNQGGQEQISIQAPFELTPGWPTSVTIDNNGNRVTATGVPVLVAQPGIFEVALPRSSNRVGAVIHLDGGLVAPDTPANRGEIVSLFLTGAGPLHPPVATGQVGNVPPATTALPVVVGVGNVGCSVQFSGYAPGALGLYQINFEVSPEGPVGQSVPLIVKVGEAFSNTVALAVR